jgi:hypothetical protein
MVVNVAFLKDLVRIPGMVQGKQNFWAATGAVVCKHSMLSRSLLARWD